MEFTDFLNKANEERLDKEGKEREQQEAEQASQPDPNDNAWKYISAGDISGLADYTDRNYNYRNIPFLGQIVGNAADSMMDIYGDTLTGAASLVGAQDSVKDAADWFHNKAAEGRAQLPQQRTLENSDDLYSYLTDPAGAAMNVGNLLGSMAAFAPVGAGAGALAKGLLGATGVGARLVPYISKAADTSIGAKVLPKVLPAVDKAGEAILPGARGYSAAAGRAIQSDLATALGWGIGSGAAEAASEAGNTYDKLIANHVPQAEAQQKAKDVFWQNLALLAGTNTVRGFALSRMLGLNKSLEAPGIKSFLGNTALEGVMNTYEEGAQQGFQMGAKGQNYTLNPYEMMTNPAYAEQKEMAVEGGLGSVLASPLMAGAGAARRYVGNRLANNEQENKPVDATNIVNKMENEAKQDEVQSNAAYLGNDGQDYANYIAGMQDNSAVQDMLTTDENGQVAFMDTPENRARLNDMAMAADNAILKDNDKRISLANETAQNIRDNDKDMKAFNNAMQTIQTGNTTGINRLAMTALQRRRKFSSSNGSIGVVKPAANTQQEQTQQTEQTAAPQENNEQAQREAEHQQQLNNLVNNNNGDTSIPDRSPALERGAINDENQPSTEMRNAPTKSDIMRQGVIRANELLNQGKRDEAQALLNALANRNAEDVDNLLPDEVQGKQRNNATDNANVLDENGQPLQQLPESQNVIYADTKTPPKRPVSTEEQAASETAEQNSYQPAQNQQRFRERNEVTQLNPGLSTKGISGVIAERKAEKPKEPSPEDIERQKYNITQKNIGYGIPSDWKPKTAREVAEPLANETVPTGNKDISKRKQLGKRIVEGAENLGLTLDEAQRKSALNGAGKAIREIQQRIKEEILNGNQQKNQSEDNENSENQNGSNTASESSENTSEQSENAENEAAEGEVTSQQESANDVAQNSENAEDVQAENAQEEQEEPQGEVVGKEVTKTVAEGKTVEAEKKAEEEEPVHLPEQTAEEKAQTEVQEFTDPSVEFNLATEDSQVVTHRRDIMRQHGFTDKEIQQTESYFKKVKKIIEEMSAKYTEFGDWQERISERIQKLNDNEAWYPKVSAFVSNGEYKLNLDLGTSCIRRESREHALNVLIKNGKLQQLGAQEIGLIDQALKDCGYKIACKMCFVEARRVRQLDSANTIGYQWKAVLEGIGITDGQQLMEDDRVGVDRKLTKEQQHRLDMMTSKKQMYDKNGKPMTKKKDGKTVPYTEADYAYAHFIKAAAKKGSGDNGLTAARMSRIAGLMQEDHGLMGEIDADMLMTKAGSDALRKRFYATGWMGFLKSVDGAGTPKPTHGFTVFDALSYLLGYDNRLGNGVIDFSDEDNKIIQTLRDVYSIGGFRGQSFSDFNILQAFDYMQMILENAARRIPMHMYTKVPELVDLFGMCNIKINMSLVPEVNTPAHPKYGKAPRGLKYNDKGQLEYAWADECFPLERAKEFRNNPKLNGNVGTIAIAVSPEQFRMLLEDPEIDMVIPYHESGMPVEVRKKTGFNKENGVSDFTKQQDTTGKFDGNIKALNKVSGLPMEKKEFKYNSFLRAVQAELEKGKVAEKDRIQANTLDLDYIKAVNKLMGKDMVKTMIKAHPNMHAGQITAEIYKAWCAKNKYTAKFDSMKNNPGYYKTLEDFRVIDKNGNDAPQKALIPNFPSTAKLRQILDKGIEERIADMNKNKAIPEDAKLTERLNEAVRYQRVSKQVRENITQRLKRLIGKTNVVLMDTNKMLAELDARHAMSKKKIEEFKNGNGVIYGFAVDGKIFLNEDRFNGNTPAHEFAHIWAKVIMQQNKELWERGKELLKGTEVYNEVADDPNYQHLEKDSDAFYSEVLARIVGAENEKVTSLLVGNIQVKQSKTAASIAKKVQSWIKEVFKAIRDILAPENAALKDMTYEEFVNAPINAIWNENAANNFIAEYNQFKGGKSDAEISEQRYKYDTEGNPIEYHMMNENDSEEKKKIAELDKMSKEGKTFKAYRAMALIDGKLYPPMATMADSKNLAPASEIGKWEQSDTNYDKGFFEIDTKDYNANKELYKSLGITKKQNYTDITPTKKDGAWQAQVNGKWIKLKTDKITKEPALSFDLRKDNNEVVPARFNPYLHSSAYMLNDQFSSAYKRPNLVVVEMELPTSELSAGYRAKLAKDSVGKTKWKSGPVVGELTQAVAQSRDDAIKNGMSETEAERKHPDRARDVYLSRWGRPIRVVPTTEVAQAIKKQLGDYNVGIPANTVNPELAQALKDVGVEITAPEKKEAKSYNKWLAENGEVQFSIEDNEQLLAPNGKPSNLTPKQYQQVRTKAFKDWFGDWENDAENASKVVDENGEPLVVDGLFLKLDSKKAINNSLKRIEKAKQAANKIRAEEKRIGIKFVPDNSYELEKFFYNASDEVTDIYGGDRLDLPFIVDAIIEGHTPKIRVAFRYGDISETMTSHNFAEDTGEKGVSVVGRVAEMNTDKNKYYDAFFGKHTYNIVVGVDVDNKGSDGEMLLSPAYVIGKASELALIAKSATDNNGNFSKDNDNILLSAEADNGQHEYRPITIDDVKEACGNAAVKEVRPGVFRATFESGAKLYIHAQDNIVLTEAEEMQARRDHKIPDGVPIFVNGAQQGNTIDLSNYGEKGTIHHELEHFAEKFMTKDQLNALKKFFGDAEQRADGYLKYRENPRQYKGIIGKACKVIDDVYNAVARLFGNERATAEHVMSQIQSGEIFNQRENFLDNADENGNNEGKKFMATINSNHSGYQGGFSITQKIANLFRGKSKDTGINRKILREQLEDLTGLKIRWGKLEGPEDVVFKEVDKIIRAKSAYDFEKVIPVAGKAICSKLGIKSTDEMNNYIADWIMTGATNNTSQEATDFAEAMKKNPDFADKLMDVRDSFDRYNHLSAMEKARAIISFENIKDTRFTDMIHKAYDQWFEELGPVKRMVEDIERNGKFKFTNVTNPYTAFRLFRGNAGRAMALLEGKGDKIAESLQNIWPNVDFTDFKTLHQILDEVGAIGNKDAQEKFAAYCLAKHVKDIHLKNAADPSAEQMETPMTEKECDDILNDADNQTKFDKAQQDLVRLSNTILSIYHQSGMMSDSKYYQLKNAWKNYVPMFRTFDEDETVVFGDSTKHLTGSQRDVVNPLESIIRNTFKFVNQAEKNQAKQKLAGIARCGGLGQIVEEVDQAGKVGETISFREGGKVKYLQTDKEIVNAINNMGMDSSNQFIQLLRAPASIARAAFTVKNLSFAARNVFRDVADAMIYSKYGFNPVKDFPSGFMHALHKDDLYYEWLASGAAQSGRLTLDRDYTQSTLDEMTKTFGQRGAWDKVMTAINYVNDLSEQGTRIGVYERNKKAMLKDGAALGEAIAEAAYQSRDLMDFARGGKASRSANQLIIFANAGLQGWDKFFRTFDPKDKKSFARAGAKLMLYGMLPALMLALTYSDDDWWKELPEWQKQGHWCMKIGDTILRVPKGADIGIRFFSNLIENMVAHVKSNKEIKADNLLKPLYDNLPDWQLTATAPIVEAMANYSFFTERPIVPRREQKLPAKMQYGDQTSGLAKYLGEKLDISPRKIDHVLYGYTGNLGKGIVGTLDSVAGQKKITDFTKETAPVASGLLTIPYKSPQTVEDYYKTYDKQSKYKAEYQQTKVKPDGYDPQLLKRLDIAKKPLQRLADQERKVISDSNLTAKDKQNKQIEIQQKRIEIMKRALNK